MRLSICQQLYAHPQVLFKPPAYTSTIGAHHGTEVVFKLYSNSRSTTMVSTRNNNNNNRMVDEQITLIQALQAQMEELRQKGIAE